MSLPWIYTDSWALYAQTAGLILVKRALDRGLAGQAAIDFINTQPEIKAYPHKATVCPAGSPWMSELMWYGKGSGYDGKFQCVKPDGPFTAGWSVRWAASSYVNGTVPTGFPVGADGKHPTAWEVHSEGNYNASIPVPPIPTGDGGGGGETGGTDGTGGGTPQTDGDLAELLVQIKALREDIAALKARPFPSYVASNRWLGTFTLTPKGEE